MRRSQFERWLTRHGAYLVRHGSRHDIWARGERQASVPRHTKIRAGTARAICKQLEIPAP